MLKLEIPTYNNVWFDNGLVTLYELLELTASKKTLDINPKLSSKGLSVEIPDVEKFGEELSAEIRENRRSMIVNQEKDGTTKEIKKDFLLLQEGKKERGKVRIKEIVFRERNEEFIKNCLDALLEEGKRNCVICGREYNPGDARSKLKLKQSVYPLATKTKSLSGIRTYKNEEYLKFSKPYHDNICPLCYLTGVLNWENEALIYRTFVNEGLSYVFLPALNDLVKLRDFRTGLKKGLLNNEERWSNIKVKPKTEGIENTPGKFSTLLCFYEKFLDYIGFENICSEWNIFRIPLGNVKNVKTFSVDTKDNLLGVLKELIEEDNLIYDYFIKKVNFFKRTSSGTNIDWDITNAVREKLAESFLKDEFKSFTRSMLPRKGGHIGFSKEDRKVLEDLLYHWKWKKMSIDKGDVGSIRSVGNIVSKTCMNNPSLLYKLDKVKNKEELWDSLRQVSRKLAGLEVGKVKGKVSPKSLDDLIKMLKENEKDWKEIKNLLVIYSSMYYSIGRLDKSGGENNESK